MHTRRAWVPFLLIVSALVACGGDSSTAPAIGQLAISTDGLPTGVTPSIVVSGPADFRRTVEGNQTLTSLPQGTYSVVAQEVVTGGVRYSGVPATQTIQVTGATVVSATQILYGVASARLTIMVTGLPTGAAAGITLSGPRGDTRTLTGTTSLELLEAGTWTIVARDVTVSGRTYRAALPTQTVGLSNTLSPTSATVDYGVGSGSLDVAVSGLPPGVDAIVDVAGPGGFTRRLAASTLLQRLEGGSYTITAAIVRSVLTTNVPTPAQQTITVADNVISTASVRYAGTPLELAATLFVGNLVQPVFLTAPPGDPRQFIVERGGRVRLVVGEVLQAAPFLDMTSRVNNNGERGLLGMTFDPAYASNGLFYVYYVARDGNVVLERITSTPGANVASGAATIIISIPHGGSEHHGGMIEFGPDGMLYLAPGDGACCGDPRGNGQNLGTLLGKVLRLDVRTLPYTAPADNRFLPATALPEIWAYGLRNPWRFSFDTPTNTLFIGDVGQDAREEVNAVVHGTSGINYGWPFTEGNACYNPTINCTSGRVLTSPVLDYPHSDGCSVTGGYVYRGSALPELVGHYLYADFCRGWLRSFRLVSGRATDLTAWTRVSIPQANSFGRDGAGELYVIARTNVWKLVRATN